MRRLAFALAILVVASAASAAERDTEAGADLRRIQAEARDVRSGLLDLVSDLGALEDDIRFPAADRLRIYLGAAPELDSAPATIQVALAGRTVANRDYDDAQRRILAEGGADLVHETTAEPGELEMLVLVRPAGDEADAPRRVQRLALEVPKGPHTVGIWLTVGEDGGLSASLRERPDDERGSWARAHARYRARLDGPLPALATLKRAGLARTDLERAEWLLDYGLLETAEDIYRRRLKLNLPDQLRNRAWFELARAWMRRGNVERAHANMERIFGIVPEDIREAVIQLRGRIQIARGDYDKAARAWRKHLIDHAEGNDGNPFLRFNLGVALIRAGKVEEGSGELHKVGQEILDDTDESVRLALRDRANLAMGYAFLELGQGASARALFKDVRLDGPFANKALLGLGWAELAPDGSAQRYVKVERIHCSEDPARLLPDNLPILRRQAREACGRPQTLRDGGHFDTHEGGDDETERVQRALAPWQRLVERDPLDPAVQEALVATPYMYVRIDQTGKADQRFGQAIDVLETQRARIERAIAATEQTGNDILGDAPPAQRWRLPEPLTAYHAGVDNDRVYRAANRGREAALSALAEMKGAGRTLSELEAVLTSRRNAAYNRDDQQALERYAATAQRLDRMRERLSALRERVKSAGAEFGRLQRQRVRAHLVERREALDTYLARARLGRARLLDEPAEPRLEGL